MSKFQFKNEAELLATFSNPNYPGLEQYRHPFFNERTGQVWATNGHVLLSVAPHRLSGDYPTMRLGDPDMFTVHSCDMTVTMSMLADTLASVPQIKEKVEVGPAIECEECEGTGEVQWEYQDGALRIHYKDDACPVCDGRGVLHEAVYKETGRVVPDPEARIEAGNAIVLARDVQKLVSVMKFFGADSVNLVRSDDAIATKWVIDEDIFVVIMPMPFKSNTELVTKLKGGDNA